MSAITSGADEPIKKSFNEVWVVCTGHALTHWYPATFYLLMPLIGKELGLSYSQIGGIISFQYAAGAIANIPGGILVDSVGRKGLLMALSLFWIGFPYLVMGYSHTYAMFLACAVMVGIGNNLWHPTAIPWLGNRFSERRGLVMSFHGMGGNFGDAVAPLVVGFLLTMFTWRDVMVMNVIPGIFMSIAILIYIGRIQSAEKKTAKTEAKADVMAGFVQLLKNRSMVMLSLSSGFRSLTQGALMAFLPLYLANNMGYDVKWVGMCMFAVQAAGFIAAPIAGHLSDKMGRRQIIMGSFSVTAVVILGMIFVGGTDLFVLLIALLGFFLFSIRAVMQAWLLDATPKHMGGSAIGIMFGSQAVAQAIGPYTAGVLADSYGIMTAFYFLAFTIVLANVFVFFTPMSAKDVKV